MRIRIGEDGRFNYRVAGILLHAGRVLLHRNRRGYWALPGGHIEFMEPAAETLRREMREELGVEVTVERLVWVTEHFFRSREGERVHEMAWYFLMSLPGGHPLFERSSLFEGAEGPGLMFGWYPLAELAALELYPQFLRERLPAIPPAIEHLVMSIDR